jgi:hypothetical protein
VVFACSEVGENNTNIVNQMQGKVLIQQQINSQDAVPVNNFARGIYIYNVRMDKENRMGKVIIKN